MIKRGKNVAPIAQAPHDVENCQINESPHNHPYTDCGHDVDGPGPGTYAGHVPGGPGHKNCDHE